MAEKNKSEAFQLMLRKVKSEELKAFVEEYADKGFKTQFLLHFADQLPLSGNEKYRALVNSIIDSVMQANAVTDGIDGQKITRPLNSLLKQAEEQFFSKNYLDPFHLAGAIILKSEGVFNYGDDIAFLIEPIERSFDLLKSIIKSEVGYDLKESIFKLAEQETTKPETDPELFSHQWISLLMNFNEEEKQKRVLEIIDDQIERIRYHRRTSSGSPEEDLLKKKIFLLDSMGRKEEAQSVRDENLHIKSFRKSVIDEAIAAKNFSAAKELIRESKQIEEQKGKWNVSSEWDELLLLIALEEQQTRNIRAIAQRLFFNRYDMDYYRILKNTYQPAAWSKEVDAIVETIRKKKFFGLQDIRAIAAIYVEENSWNHLLTLMKKNESLEFIEPYFDIMKDTYGAELVPLYKEALRRYAEHKMGNEHYMIIANTLNKLYTLPSGADVAKALLIEFKVKYRHRRNLIRPLNKLLF